MPPSPTLRQIWTPETQILPFQAAATHQPSAALVSGRQRMSDRWAHFRHHKNCSEKFNEVTSFNCDSIFCFPLTNPRWSSRPSRKERCQDNQVSVANCRSIPSRAKSLIDSQTSSLDGLSAVLQVAQLTVKSPEMVGLPTRIKNEN